MTNTDTRSRIATTVLAGAFVAGLSFLAVRLGVDVRLFDIRLAELKAGYWIIGLALFIASVAFDLLIGDLESDGRDRGYTADFVVVGVLYTLAGASLYFGVELAAAVAIYFGFSGIPMIIGSRRRHMARRRADEQQINHLISQQLSTGTDDARPTVDRSDAVEPGAHPGQTEQ